jgi:hypothetical protein
MNDDISLLWDFLERCGPEVRGHGLAGLGADQIAMIERFIAGRSDDLERRELSEFLQLHPAWIRWIADRVKMARELGEKPAGQSSGNETITA